MALGTSSSRRKGGKRALIFAEGDSYALKIGGARKRISLDFEKKKITSSCLRRNSVP